MLNIENQTLFSKIVSAAIEAVYSNVELKDWIAARWIRAIEKAVDQIEENGNFMEWMPDTKSLIIFSQKSNKIYSTNGVCQCPAFDKGYACWHRSAARLTRLYFEAMDAPTASAIIEKEVSYLPPTKTNPRRVKIGGIWID